MKIAKPMRPHQRWQSLITAILLIIVARAPLAFAQTPPAPNTPAGSNIVVSPVDGTLNLNVAPYQPVTLTFGTVTQAGTTSLRTRYDVTPPPPDGLQTGSPPIYFDLSTTALYDASGIGLCVDIRGMSLANPAEISIYQLQGTWASLTSTITPGTQICTRTFTLGTFAIFYPQVPETRISTIAGTGFARNSIDGPGGDPRDDANDGSPAAAAALTPVTATLDRAHNILYVSDLSTVIPDPLGMGSYIRKIDLSTGIITRVLGVPETANSLALDSAGDLYFTAGCQVRKFSFSINLISVVAGTGTCGFAGDGQDAKFAQIQPLDGQIAFDRLDNLFIADSQNSRIRRVDAVTGIISTVAGNGTLGPPFSGSRPTLTGFKQAAGLAFDNQGNLLLVAGLLMRISPGADGMVNGSDDEVLTVLSGCRTGCTAPYAGDGGPISDAHAIFNADALSVASDGAVLLDERLQRIRRIDPGADHVVTGASDEVVWTVAGFHYPPGRGLQAFNGDTFSTQSSLAGAGLALEDTSGNLLIIDTNNNRIRLTGYSPSLVNKKSTSADLSIAAAATPNPVDSQSVLTYSPITIKNNGPATASGVKFNFPLPSSANFDSVTTSQGTCSAPAVGSSGSVSCDLGSIDSGGTVTISVGVKPQTAGPLNATLSVSGTETDPNPANNSITVGATVNLGPAVINITETIKVTDAVNVLPSAMLGVNETINVTDVVNVLPSAMLGVSETIRVTDAVNALPSAMLGVSETIHVADSINLSIPNAPPVVTPPSSIVVAATQVSGATGNASPALRAFLLSGTTTDDTDPAPQRLNPQADLGAGLVDVDDKTVFPVKTTAVQFAFRDKDGATGTALANVTVNPPVGGAVNIGGIVVVTPTDGNNVPQPLQLTFTTVDQPGLVTAMAINPVPSPPPGFSFVTPVVDISTTAFFTPPVTVCFLGSGFSANDQLWHAGTLIGATTISSTEICAQTTSLSPFGVVRLLNRPPTATASAPATVEATSSAGASVTLSGSGSDPDNDPLTFIWSENGSTLGSGAQITVTLPSGLHMITLTANDGRGGSGTASVTVTVQDTTPPSITIATPAPGNLILNQAVSANYSCADTASGVATCVGPVTNGASLDTSIPGSFSFTVSASDKAGNTASRSVNYTVGYNICLLYDPTMAKKSGSTYPIQIRLCDAAGKNVSASTIVVHAVSVTMVSNNAPGVLQDAGNANPDFDFRYDANLGGYIFNLKTTGYATGTYNLNFTAGSDPVVHSAGFQIK